MKILVCVATNMFLAAVCCAPACGQGMPEASAEHQWLKKFVGTRDVKSRSEPLGDVPAMESSGVIESEM